ncbi:MAG: tRNA dihydrouridine synthase [Promethearchaeota archaeon]|jgi:tRNA-dihydrouridine synthase B
MKLGTLNLVNRYILAPMQNVTTAPYRRFCREVQKIGLVSVPMIYTKNIVNNPKSLDQELYKIEEENPISIQIIGSDTNALKKAIDYLESYEFDLLDINAGCPSRRAVNAKEGGYLMKDLEKLGDLLRTAVKYSTKPISLKVRTGFEKPMDVKKFSIIMNDSGIDFLIIHARTVKNNFFEGTIDLETVKQLKKSLTIPLVGNGDITNPKDAKNFIDYTEVDALMIGRESMGNPMIFQQIHEYFSNGESIPFQNSVGLMVKHINLYEAIIDDYLNGISFSYGNEKFKFAELKRNSIWLTKGIEKSRDLRIQLSKTKNLGQLKKKIEEFRNRKNRFSLS